MAFNNDLVFTLIHWIVSAIALMLTSALIKNFEVEGFLSALVTSFVIGVADMYLRPVLLFLTLPITILTLGLFILVVNGIVLKICAALLPGFNIRSWGAAIFGALVLSVLNTALHFIFV